MKTRIIFQDFDGVFNSVRSAVATQKVGRVSQVVKDQLLGNQIESGFDAIAVALVRRLAELSGAKIVISSAWRFNMNLLAIRGMFASEFGWPSGSEQLIIGTTPRTTDAKRGEEIEQWIEENTVGVQNFEYVIIDDSSDLLDHQFKRFVQVDPYEGFLLKDYKKALALFNLNVEGID